MDGDRLIVNSSKGVVDGDRLIIEYQTGNRETWKFSFPSKDMLKLEGMYPETTATYRRRRPGEVLDPVIYGDDP